MRVIYFHQHFSTPQGAAGTRSYELARRLIARGHEVTMVCGSFGRGETGLRASFHKGIRRGLVDEIDVIELDLAYSNADGFLKRSVTFLKYALRSVLLVLREPYDIIFATTTPLTAGVPGIIARWLRRKLFVFEVRDLWPELPREMGVITNPVILGMMSALEWASYHSAHYLIGLSPGIVEGIARRGVKKEKIAMIPNGCDLELFAQKIEPWRPEGVQERDLMAIFTGTHGEANGLDTVLDVARELKRRKRFDIKLVLIGEGKLKPSLQQRASAEALDNIIFHHSVSKIRLVGLMAAADVGMQILANVSAFYYGTSPNKFFDYIASGLPVLNNYPGWLAEIIREYGCGVAVPPDDAIAFADALVFFADDRQCLAQMGIRAKILAKSKFSRNLLAEQWIGVLEGVCRQRYGFGEIET